MVRKCSQLHVNIFSVLTIKLSDTLQMFAFHRNLMFKKEATSFLAFKSHLMSFDMHPQILPSPLGSFFFFVVHCFISFIALFVQINFKYTQPSSSFDCNPTGDR